MRYRILTAGLAAALSIGCSETATAPTESFTPSFDGASGCYTPQFNVTVTLVGPAVFEGTVTGDLEGSLTWVFDGQGKFVGAVGQTHGMAYWTITGGMIPGLGAFETEFDNTIHLSDRPDSPFLLAEVTGKHRAVSGVEKANLTYTGLYNVGGTAYLETQGVICP